MDFINILLVISLVSCISIRSSYSTPVRKLKPVDRENPVLPNPLSAFPEESDSTPLFPSTSENGKSIRRKSLTNTAATTTTTTTTETPPQSSTEITTEKTEDQTSPATQTEDDPVKQPNLGPQEVNLEHEEAAPSDISQVFVDAGDNMQTVDEPTYNEYNLNLYSPPEGDDSQLLAANLITALGLPPQASFTQSLLAAYALPNGPQLVQNILSQLVSIDDNLILLIVKSLGREALQKEGLNEEQLTDFLLDDDNQTLFLLKKLFAEAAKGKTAVSIQSVSNGRSSQRPKDPSTARGEDKENLSEEFDDVPLSFDENPGQNLPPRKLNNQDHLGFNQNRLAPSNDNSNSLPLYENNFGGPLQMPHQPNPFFTNQQNQHQRDFYSNQQSPQFQIPFQQFGGHSHQQQPSRDVQQDFHHGQQQIPFNIPTIMAGAPPFPNHFN